MYYSYQDVRLPVSLMTQSDTLIIENRIIYHSNVGIIKKNFSRCFVLFFSFPSSSSAFSFFSFSVWVGVCEGLLHNVLRDRSHVNSI